MSLTGVQFKQQYPGPYYKWLTDNLTHNRLAYQLCLDLV